MQATPKALTFLLSCRHVLNYGSVYYLDITCMDSLAEWSKALAPGASPQGRGFEPHSCHSCYAHAQLMIVLRQLAHHLYVNNNKDHHFSATGAHSRFC